MKPGYKQTEVGVIPEEWGIAELDETARVVDSLHQTPSFAEDGYPMVRVTDIKPGNLSFVGTLMVTEAVFAEFTKSYKPKRGDIVLSRVGSYGVSSFVETDEPFCMGQNTVVLQPKLPPRFLYYVLNSRSIRQQIEDGSYGSGYKSLSLKNIKELRIPVPPTDDEQRAIATALSDVDGLLGGLDRLIAKKRDLKQAAMQQLLTGQTRLPGFHGEWVVKRLGELFNFSGGYSASRDQLSTEGHCYLHYGDIHGSTKTCIDTDADFQNIPKLDIPLKRVSSASLLDDGDVVFVDASEDDAGTSKHVVVVNKSKKPFISGLHTIVAKSKTDELAHEFRRYCFQTPTIRQQFLFYSVGTKVSGISKSNIPKLTLSFPSVPEQTAIAEVLTEMDAELAVLEQRREKTRALKQAMMQELLTGRTRLVTTPQKGGRA
jgi:type I restriction enzyme S subunit